MNTMPRQTNKVIRLFWTEMKKEQHYNSPRNGKLEFTGLNKILEFILTYIYIKTNKFNSPNKVLLVFMPDVRTVINI